MADRRTRGQDAEAVGESRQNLAAPQRQLIATARNDITIPFFTDVMSVNDDTLIQRGEGKGLKLYDEIERDTYAYAVLQKRKFALIGREWEVRPASESAADKKAAVFAEEQIRRINFDQVCLDLLDATLKGYAVTEVVWRRDGTAIIPQALIGHDPRRFVFDSEWRPRLLTREASLSGIELPERKFIVHRFGVKGNNPYGLGLGTRLFWPVLFKREGVAFWLTYLEKFASPTPVGKYPMGTLAVDQSKLLDTLVGMSQSGAVVVPIGTELSFMEAARAGQAGYETWCEYWDNQMSLCVFGANLGTNVQGSGSRAAADVHKETEDQIIDADGDLLSDTLRNSLLTWLVDYNMPGAGVPTLHRLRPTNENDHESLREKRAKNAALELDQLFNLAARVGPAQFAEIAAELSTHGIIADVPIVTLRKLAPLIATPPMVAAGIMRGAANDSTAPSLRQATFEAAARSDGHDHGMSALASQLGVATESTIEGWLMRIRDLLDASVKAGDNPLQFGEKLLALHPELTVDQLGNVISQAMAVADLSGRADVGDELAARGKARR